MANRGKILKKVETGIPKCVVIQFDRLDELQLQVTIGKAGSYRRIHRSLGTTDWAEAMKRFGPLYAEVIAEPDEFSRKHSIHLNKLVDEFHYDLFMPLSKVKELRQAIGDLQAPLPRHASGPPA